MKVRAHVVISGRVQGVFFRAHTRDFARKFNVNGWVKNRSDGKVEALLEGDQEDVKAVIDWCKDGPPGAHVSGVDVKWESYVGEFNGFEIIYH
jgi:acylphosphatase